MAGTSGSIDRDDNIVVEVDTRAIAMELVCADGVTAIRYIKSLNGVDTETFIGADGDPITPTAWVPGPCPVFTPSIDQQEICADGEPALRVVGYDIDGSDFEFFLGEDGETITPTVWFPGSCCACPDDPITVVPGVRAITGVTPFTPPGSNYRSITLIVDVNTVQISYGGSDVAIIKAGKAMSWGGDGPQDGYLGTVPTFTGQNVASEYTVHWTKH